MNSKEYINYLKENKLLESMDPIDIERLEYFIKRVVEIENICSEYKVDMGPPYLKKVMLLEDYIRILKDLRNVRIIKFYRMLKEKEKYLNKLEMPKDQYDLNIEEYKKELLKKLNLRADLHPIKRRHQILLV